MKASIVVIILVLGKCFNSSNSIAISALLESDIVVVHGLVYWAFTVFVAFCDTLISVFCLVQLHKCILILSLAVVAFPSCHFLAVACIFNLLFLI